MNKMEPLPEINSQAERKDTSVNYFDNSTLCRNSAIKSPAGTLVNITGLHAEIRDIKPTLEDMGITNDEASSKVVDDRQLSNDLVTVTTASCSGTEKDLTEAVGSLPQDDGLQTNVSDSWLSSESENDCSDLESSDSTYTPKSSKQRNTKTRTKSSSKLRAVKFSTDMGKESSTHHCSKSPNISRKRLSNRRQNLGGHKQTSTIYEDEIPLQNKHEKEWADPSEMTCIYVQPPADVNDKSSEDESSDEFPKRLQVLIDSSSEDDEPLGQLKKRSKVGNILQSKTQKQVFNWVMGTDLSQTCDQLIWKYPAPTTDEDLSPFSLFERFFTQKLLELIADQTNNYAASKGSKSFLPTSADELKRFIAICLISGYISLPRRSMFWEGSPDCFIEAVSSCMPRNRFNDLMRFLHFADNTKLDKGDIFAKVRPLLDAINDACVKYYQPTEFVSVDESMVCYYGRHGAKQFVRGKPIRYGYKLWAICTPLGYMIQFYPYNGKGSTDRELGLGGSVVSTLVNRLPKGDGIHYHVVFDNFFTSVKLLVHLKETYGCVATGTCRRERLEQCPLPDVKQVEKEPRGTFYTASDAETGVVLTRWRDTKVVTFASTYSGSAPVGQSMRWSNACKARVAIDRPNVVNIYNKNMGGVDRTDQNIAEYPVSVRNKKWWWPLFRFCVDLAVQNAWHLYRLQVSEGHSPPLDLLAFRRRIAQYYIALTPGRPMGRRPNYKPADRRVLDEIRYDGQNHWIVRHNVYTKRRCASCKGQSAYACEKCDVGLHPDCFKKFHIRNSKETPV